ncbi:MAG TPA: ubiquinone/menaquinone biosynthesis methyltransferase [Gemmatimonadales bacterium]|nr:ubiquinone/menaquinone biosynthesis methyltransferase [Gemmatimonadales bacterium]
MPPAPSKTPLTDGDAKRSYVREMFTAIAPRYDLLNHLLSLNVDRWWRRRAVRRLGWERAPDGIFLDACAGTLDLAAELAGQTGFAGRVVAADFVVPMLELGRGKATRVDPIGADALQLPFAEGSFAGATVGFGVRNLADLRAGLAELKRVVRPGGRVVILEFTTPRNAVMRGAFGLYFRRILPFVGRVVSKHMTAYTYLPDSVERFPAPDALAAMMRAVGFADVGYDMLTAGIAAVHWGMV